MPLPLPLVGLKLGRLYWRVFFTMREEVTHDIAHLSVDESTILLHLSLRRRCSKKSLK
jgi:hypothetical protein